MNPLEILGRNSKLFGHDLKIAEAEIVDVIRTNSFLVIGGGGSIGQAVTRELFSRSAKLLHVVDLNENYLVELVRDLRSEFGYATPNFDTFAIDCGSRVFDDFMNAGQYDFVLNLSAMKHVRSENNAFSMLRMIETNVFNAISTYNTANSYGAKKYFCVSTDKAANPANFMGATKRAMEISLMRNDAGTPVCGARFANVAFSNGSLLQGFEYRLQKKQPFSTPSDIRRFFVTSDEAGIICLFSALLGEKNEIMFPYSETEMTLNLFLKIAHNYLASQGKKGIEFVSEEEARQFIKTGDLDKYWPINVFESDTVGEKPFEEFYTNKEELIRGRFCDLASVNFTSQISREDILNFQKEVYSVQLSKKDARDELIGILQRFVPTFSHASANKFLNSRM